jgi:hypothetical protein
MPVEGTTRARSPLFWPDQLQPGESVRFAPAPQFLEPWKFLRISGHNNFAADLMRDVVRTAEFDHGARPLDT